MKMLRLILIAFFLVHNCIIIAQGVGRWDSISAVNTVNLFCEPGFISATEGVGNLEPLIFEADIIPYYMIGTRSKSHWGAGISPRFILRMYNKESFPVRTPSYLPRVIISKQFLNQNKQKDLFLFASWFHHSNGQDGAFFNEDSTTINTSSGNFSTNWLEAGMFFSRQRGANIHFFKMNALYSYKQDENLDRLYGRYRTFLDYQSQWNLSKTLRFLHSDYFENNKVLLTNYFRVGYIGGNVINTKSFDLKRLIFRYTVTYKPAYFRDVSFFIQYYYGQDYYNIYFNRTLKVLRFGLIAKTSIFN